MKKWMLRIGTLAAVLAGSIFAQDIAGDRQRDESPHSVQFVTVDRDVKLELLNWGGSGRPLVLLAGLGSTAHVFDDFAPKLTTCVCFCRAPLGPRLMVHFRRGGSILPSVYTAPSLV